MKATSLNVPSIREAIELNQYIVTHFDAWCISRNLSWNKGCKALGFHPYQLTLYRQNKSFVPLDLAFRILGPTGNKLIVAPIQVHKL